jgi:sugar phosphate isomerase/epimerase
VLQHLASCGYKQIETFEGPKGIFWGMENTGFNNYIGELGMQLVSAHNNVYANFEKKVDEAAVIGLKYLTYNWEGPSKTLDDYKKMANDFNTKGELCKKNGVRFAFHNHDYTFRLMEGQYAQDILMQNTDPSLVDFEMDIYWVVAAGQDPEAWLRKYPNRFRLCHVKDRTKNPGKDDGKNSVDLGTGSIDFSKVLKTARENGMQYFIVEQEAYPNGTPSEAVRVDAEYMKKLKI